MLKATLMAQFHLVGKLCVCVRACVKCLCIVVAFRRLLTDLALPQRMVQVMNQLIARGVFLCFLMGSWVFSTNLAL